MGHEWKKIVFVNKHEDAVGIMKDAKFGVKMPSNVLLTPILVSHYSFGVIFTLL